MMKTIFHKILATTALCLAAGAEQSDFPAVVWEDVTVVSAHSDCEAAMHFITQLRPMVPGKIFWKEHTYNTSSTEPPRRNLHINLCLYGDSWRPRFNIHPHNNATLYVEWSKDNHREATAAFMQALKPFCKDGKLCPVERETLEDALRYHVAYRTLNWNKLQIVCSAQCNSLARDLKKALQPYIDGEIRVVTKASQEPDSVCIRLTTYEGPTRAALDYLGDNSVKLLVSHTGNRHENMQQACEGFVAALRPLMNNGKLTTVKDGVLWDSLRSAFHTDTVRWHNIVVCSISEKEATSLIDALRQMTDGHICWRKMGKRILLSAAGLGNDYLCIYLSPYDETPSIGVSPGVLPSINLSYGLPHPRRQKDDETAAQYEARWDAMKQAAIEHFIHKLRSLTVNGKLPDISVQQLQQKLNNK